MLKPCNPKLLIAMPDLQDPNFHQSVVLIVQDNEDGAFGFVINRKLPFTIDQLTGEQQHVARSKFPHAAVFQGGPVATDTAWVLHRATHAQQNWVVAENLFLSSSLPAFEAVAQHESQFLFLIGYAGWSFGQLESEINAGAWMIADIDIPLIFSADVGQMWTRAMNKIGIEPQALVPGNLSIH